MTASTADDTANPMPVPIDASNAVWPVASALERSTDNVPSATQNAWSTPSTRASSTAADSATPARSASRNHTELGIAYCPRKRPNRRPAPVITGAGRSVVAFSPRASSASPARKAVLRATTRECHAPARAMKPASTRASTPTAGSSEATAVATRRSAAARAPSHAAIGAASDSGGSWPRNTQAAASRQSAARAPSAVISGVSCTYGSPSSAAMTRAREPSRSTI